MLNLKFLCKSHESLKLATGLLMQALAWVVFGGFSTATEPEKAIEIEVQVIADGKPASGTAVWLEEWSRAGKEPRVARKVGPVVTSPLGTVRFSLTRGVSFYQFFAKDERGCWSLASCVPREKDTTQLENRLTLTLKGTQQIKGRFYFEDKPLAAAECTLSMMHAKFQLESGTLEPSFGTRFSATSTGAPVSLRTDREGRFAFDGIPTDASAGLTVSKNGMGRGYLAIEAGKPNEAELKPGGQVEFSLEGETMPTTLKWSHLEGIGSPARTTPEGKKIVYLAGGTPLFAPGFSVPCIRDLEPGTYRLVMPFDPTLPDHFGPSPVLKVESGKTTKIVFKKTPVAQCSGRIVNAKTGKGIPNFAFRLRGVAKWEYGELGYDRQRFIESYPGKTDAEGNYTVACRGNHDYTISLGNGHDNLTDYEFPHWNDELQKWVPSVTHRVIEDGQKVRFPDIALPPSRTVTGVVRDNLGKVVEGPYQVFCATRRALDQKPPQFEKGQFTLTQLKPDIPLKFFIRKGKAVNVASVFPVEALDAPLSFTISEKNQVTGSGRIVDAQRKPIAGAQVTLVWLADNQQEITNQGRYMGALLKPLEVLTTDVQGRFSASGLWPREKFYLRVEAKGYQPWTPPNEGRDAFAAIGGGTIDFGDTVLTESSGDDSPRRKR